MQFLAAAAAAEEEGGGLIGHNSTSILKKESVARLGQRLLDMAEYISRELTPSVNDEFATLVHGDYKAMVSTYIRRL
jgi:chromosome condensin MukBEF complex kleisin-like MukF subunit